VERKEGWVWEIPKIIDEQIAQAKNTLANLEEEISFKQGIAKNLQQQLDALKAEADNLVTENRRQAWGTKLRSVSGH